MNGIDGWQFCGKECCDEIVNSALMEIATGKTLCFQRLRGNGESEVLQSMAYRLLAR
jgi:hypothetical protein